MIKRLLKLLFGLFLYALGIIVTIRANIGFAPWDVLHVGLSLTTGLSVGTTSILVGLAILAIVLLFKERIGVGTVLNMLLIGVFMDLIILTGLIPEFHSFWPGSAALLAGLLVISLASYFYISSGFGAGPRDSLMVLLSRKTKLPVGLIRAGIEVVVTGLGWLLGGKAGLGTLMASVLIGFCIQAVFAAFRFKPTEVRHETFMETVRSLRRRSPA